MKNIAGLILFFIILGSCGVRKSGDRINDDPGIGSIRMTLLDSLLAVSRPNTTNTFDIAVLQTDNFDKMIPISRNLFQTIFPGRTDYSADSFFIYAHLPPRGDYLSLITYQKQEEAEGHRVDYLDLLNIDSTGKCLDKIRLAANDNTAYGAFSMALNQSGGANTALGVDALGNNISGFNNTAIGVAALQMSTGTGNTATGWHALHNNAANENTAHGIRALEMNITGIRNTSIGGNSLQNNDANDNTAAGYKSLNANVNGINNSALGSFALTSNIAGNNNTAVGKSALELNIGNNNTATGVNALSENTTGSFNAAFGINALQRNTTIGNAIGIKNTALGANSLPFNTTGSSNTAVGMEALFTNSIGLQNTAIGERALAGNLDGDCNTAVGYHAGPINSSFSNTTTLGCNAFAQANMSTAIGAGAVSNVPNSMQLGNTSLTGIYVNATFYPSDVRFKSDIQFDVPGLDFILRIKPATYNFDYSKLSNFRGEKNVDAEVLMQKGQKREMGFIAQEIEKVCKETGVEISNLLHTPKSKHDNYSLAYSQLVVPLVKAVQEQQAEIEALKSQMEQMELIKQQNIILQNQLDGLRTELQSLIPIIQKQVNPD